MEHMDRLIYLIGLLFLVNTSGMNVPIVARAPDMAVPICGVRIVVHVTAIGTCGVINAGVTRPDCHLNANVCSWYRVLFILFTARPPMRLVGIGKKISWPSPPQSVISLVDWLTVQSCWTWL